MKTHGIYIAVFNIYLYIKCVSQKNKKAGERKTNAKLLQTNEKLMK